MKISNLIAIRVKIRYTLFSFPFGENTMDKGKSVGAIITDPAGRYLMQYRLKHPIGLAMPAGHMDANDESPEDAMQRVFEETGLYVRQMTRVFYGFVPGDRACKEGHKGHDWWIYHLLTEGEPRIKEPHKHLFLRFMSSKEIREWAIGNKTHPNSFPCDPNWFKYILPALNIL